MFIHAVIEGSDAASRVKRSSEMSKLSGLPFDHLLIVRPPALSAITTHSHATHHLNGKSWLEKSNIERVCTYRITIAAHSSHTAHAAHAIASHSSHSTHSHASHPHSWHHPESKTRFRLFRCRLGQADADDRQSDEGEEDELMACHCERGLKHKVWCEFQEAVERRSGKADTNFLFLCFFLPFKGTLVLVMRLLMLTSPSSFTCTGKGTPFVPLCLSALLPHSHPRSANEFIFQIQYHVVQMCAPFPLENDFRYQAVEGDIEFPIDAAYFA